LSPGDAVARGALASKKAVVSILSQVGQFFDLCRCLKAADGGWIDRVSTRNVCLCLSGRKTLECLLALVERQLTWAAELDASLLCPLPALAGASADEFSLELSQPSEHGQVTSEDQWNRFVEDVPANDAPVLSRVHFEEWSKSYLESDPESRSRDPTGVKTPLGPFSEIIKAWHGHLAYDPGKVRVPVAIIRGEWDGLVLDEDARWLFDAFTQSPVKRDIKISRATHLMHLEAMRLALWRESINFLSAGDVAPVPS
jgi:pimeloyl-ACP methyl ester carboxylesterase